MTDKEHHKSIDHRLEGAPLELVFSKHPIENAKGVNQNQGQQRDQHAHAPGDVVDKGDLAAGMDDLLRRLQKGACFDVDHIDNQNEQQPQLFKQRSWLLGKLPHETQQRIG